MNGFARECYNESKEFVKPENADLFMSVSTHVVKSFTKDGPREYEFLYVMACHTSLKDKNI
eukprot:m.3145 g.3145  ORF g.3145 m.3145 type:complete len:61 (+) comp2587_c0_seq1:48-230(+)